MSQINQVTSHLKKLLKQNGITYKQVADHLDMSEASIKRVFASSSFSLARLEQVCQLCGISLSDLFLLVEKSQPQLTHLSHEQEQELVSNTKLFLVAVCVRDAWQFDEIVEHYQIEAHELIQLMARLDKLKMIELLPNNNYKLLISQDFRWLENGPLSQFMEREVLSKFMASNFKGTHSFRFYLRGSYSQNSIAYIQKKLDQLTQEVAELNQQDAKLALHERHKVGLLMAMRPWELPMFAALKRVVK